MSEEPKTINQTTQEETPQFKRVDGRVLKKLAESGLTWLRTNQEIVNSLNVFPVPDGDTGTNMVLTMQSAYDEIVNSPEDSIGEIAHGLAHGALMGARGNSGVILSQIWRGFARTLSGKHHLDAPTFVNALAEARDTAYKGVVRPVEGTILTVAKDIAEAAKESLENTDDVLEILTYVVTAADKSVESTPELLDVLREAGVVDAGGKGLFFLLEGMLRYVNRLPLDVAEVSVKPLASLDLEGTMESIEPGQDFEVVVDFRPHQALDLESFYQELEEMGTSIQLGEGDGIYRMHIHVPTEKRYEPIDYTMELGTITKVSMENLLSMVEDLEAQPGEVQPAFDTIEPDQVAVVTVAPGPGIERVFASLGAAAIVEGGQTMNPSTQEIINAFENLPTNEIIILPNNKNIIMAAKSAAELTVKKVAVIPTRSVPEGLAAMMCVVPGRDFDDILAEMKRSMEDVISGEITTSTRSVEIDGVEVEEGQIIAMLDDKLVLSANNLKDACLGLLEIANAQDYEIITLFYGSDVPKSSANKIVDVIRSTYPNQDLELQFGGQPHYQFIISIE